MSLHAGDLFGRYVEVVGVEPLPPVGKAEPLVVHGLKGRALRWDGDSQLYTIETLIGHLFEIPPDQLQEWAPERGIDGGFDTAWPSLEDDDSILAFGQEVAMALRETGFCVVQCFMSSATRAAVYETAEEQRDWKRFAPEVEAGYLGRQAQDKVSWLESDSPDKDISDNLSWCDRLLSVMTEALEPMTRGALGFTTGGRTDGLVRMPFASSAEEDLIMASRGHLDEVQVHVLGKLEDHLKFVAVRKVCMMFFVGGQGGNLVLHRKDEPDVAIPLGEGKLVVFRHDAQSYTYMPGTNALAMQAWILAESQATLFQEYSGPADRYDQALGLLTGPPAPKYGKTGKTVSLMSMDCMLAGNGIGPDWYWSFLASGTDAVRHLSPIRWEYEWYYEANKEIAFGKYYSNHGGFVLEDSLLGFDPDFFGLTSEYASMMDPEHRNSLEVGYNVLYRAGWNRASLNGAKIGVYFGNCGTDWQNVKLNPYVTGVDKNYMQYFSNHACNARLSHTFGMRGPMGTSDTACSSSLVATGCGHNALRRVEPDQDKATHTAGIEWGLVMGTNALLGPYSWIGLCGPHMLSPTGRCFTFDHSADGFARGEGTSGLSMNVVSREPSNRLAMFCGTCVNQDGRSASMTAPHGPSQQECLWGSLREANVIPNDIKIAELHGTGTALGDPIEVGALRGVMKQRDGPVMKTSAKSNIGHGEANAGMAGLIKCFEMLLHATTPPNVHLVCLNPHIDEHEYPVIFSDELCPLGTNSGYAGVSSFGFGGTNARADLWAKALVGPLATGKVDENKFDYMVVRCPKCLGWMEHIGAEMMPTFASKPASGRYKACCLRDEFDRYEFCSLCYNGAYQLGTPPSEAPLPNSRLFITGSWDAFTTKTECNRDERGVWHFFTRLGETRVEQFRLMMEENELASIYPACKRAGMHIRADGPMPPQSKDDWNCWLIDGRDEEWPEGSFIHIYFFQDPSNGARRVRWEQVPEEGGPHERQSYRHTYQVFGTWTAGMLKAMSPSAFGGHGNYEYTMTFGVTGRELFQIARDWDLDQVIYPMYPQTSKSGVPVRGPDHLHQGKQFVIFGDQGESCTIRLSVRNGRVVVSTAQTSSKGSPAYRTWNSLEGRARRKFFVAGTWLEACEPMQQDISAPDLYRLEMCVGETGVEEFQVLVDEDEGSCYYPEQGGFPSGALFVCGPDAGGAGKTFRIEGLPGSPFEIILDLAERDVRRTVIWRPVQELGMPLMPFTNAAYSD